MPQIKKVLYTAKTHTTGGREHGVSRSSDGHLDIKLSTLGTAGVGTNPEQLFAVVPTPPNPANTTTYGPTSS